MPVKYTRNSEVQRTRETRLTPWMRQGPPVARMSRRQAMFTVAAFLTSAMLLSQIALRRAGKNPYGGRPVIRGVGTVLRTAPLAAGGGTVTLEVVPAEGKPLIGEWEIPDPYWEEIQPGARLTVIYQTNLSQSVLHIVECGIVALPDEIR